MAQYYRHNNGFVYLLIKPAKEFNTAKNVIVLKEISNRGDYYITDSLDSFSCISEKDALEKVPLWLNPKYHFPDIGYTTDKLLLCENHKFSPSVKTMKSILINHRIVDENLYEGINNDDELEESILSRVANYSEGDDVEEIFHLIQTWGGASGRGIYLFDKAKSWQNHWKEIEPKYNELVSLCRHTCDIGDRSIHSMVEGVKSFNKAVDHLGVSFITKHVRYWLSNKLKDNAFPIYDSVMAMEIMRKNTVDIGDLSNYWRGMISMSQHLNIRLVPLERQIFKYANNSR